MSYLSLTFVVFVAVSLILYYLCPKKMRGFILLCANLFFYFSFGLEHFAFLLFVALTSYIGARLLKRTKKKKLILFSFISLNALLWLVIKQLPWGVHLFKLALGFINIPFTEPSWSSLIIPIGISYYVLQAIAYLADVYKGKAEPQKRFWKYLLFLSYFPAIVQGPISRYDNLMPQLLHKNKFSFENFQNGLILVLFGIVKKMVIADRLGIFVNAIFKDYANFGGILLYLGAVGYSIQLFTDFSGCVDICRGVSSLFGIELVHNFKRPYLATSIRDFWGKWHISFSSWLKDYIYIPLGGNRKGTFRKYINIFITFLVSGIWHGAGFRFLFWGGLHASYQIAGYTTSGLRQKVKKLIGVKPNSLSERIYQSVITFNLVTLAWIFFRSEELMKGFNYVIHMFSNANVWELFDGTLYSLGVSKELFIIIFAHIFILLLIELLTKKQENVVEGLVNQHIIIRWVIYLVLIFDVIFFGVYGSGYDLSSFMYGGF